MEHKFGHACLIILATVVFVVKVVIHSIISGALRPNDLFDNRIKNTSNILYLEITPAGWAFSIWGLIYIWQILWFVYGLTTLCRSTSYGYLYVSPAHIPPIVYVLYMFNNVCNGAWLILWDRLYPEYALIFMVMLPASLYAIMYLSCSQLHASAAILKREDRSRDIWLTRVLLHNGIALYAAWVTVATLLNLAVVLTYTGGLDQRLASTISLALLLVIILVWFFMETTLLDQYVRYVISPFIALIMALTGSLAKNWNPENTNSILTAFTLGTVCVLAVIRVIMLVIRYRKSTNLISSPSLYDYGSMSQSNKTSTSFS